MLQSQNIDQTSASKSRPNFSYNIGAYQHVATLPIKYDHQLALSNFLHQPESHQSNLNNRSEFSECVTDKGRQMIGHGSDKKVVPFTSCSIHLLRSFRLPAILMGFNPLKWPLWEEHCCRDYNFSLTLVIPTDHCARSMIRERKLIKEDQNFAH